MLRTLFDRTAHAVGHHHRPHRRHGRALGAAWRALDDDPLLLCGCEASTPGRSCSC